MEIMNNPSYARWNVDPGFERDCVISRHHLEILLQGSQTEKERAYRNLFAGTAAGGGCGALSTLISHFGELFSTGIAPLESLFLTLLIATTMASTALAVFFHHRLHQTGSSEAHRVLERHIREQLEHPTAPDDPRRWP